MTQTRLAPLDTETYLFNDNNKTPKIVLGGVRTSEGYDIGTADKIPEMLQRCESIPGTVYVTANGAYDWCCIAATWPQLLPKIFDILRSGRSHDVLISEQLDAIACGMLGIDPRTGQQIKSEAGKSTGKYSLYYCTSLRMGEVNAKRSDFWRKRFALLDGLPIEDFPTEAIEYFKQDLDKTLGLAEWQRIPGNLENQEDLAHFCYSAFCLQLGAAWGLRTDPERVATLEHYARIAYDYIKDKYRAAGLLRADGTLDKKQIKLAVVMAYAVNDDIQTHCAVCGGSGKELSPVSKKPVNCRDCDSTGLDLPLSVPRTPAGSIKTDRDTLIESDDLTLAALGENEILKIVDTYIPALRVGVEYAMTLNPNVTVSSGRMSYADLIQLQPRTIKWPKGFDPGNGIGVRECFVARPGYRLLSGDFAAVELCTVSQVFLWVCGFSEMADTINRTKDPGMLHTEFAAELMGIPLHEFVARLKAGDTVCKNARDAAKAGNFGFLAQMAALTMVLAKRKPSEGRTPDTYGRVFPGIRFCILLAGRPTCGERKVTKWGNRDCAPTCLACLETVQDIRKGFFKKWPETTPYFEWCKDMMRNSDRAECFSPIVNGKKLVNRIRGGLDFKSLANNGFQALAGDIIRRAHIAVTEECYLMEDSPLYGSRIPAAIHDELLLESPEIQRAAGDRLAEVMTREGSILCPDICLRVEVSAMHYWTKAAKPIRGADGYLDSFN